jgi:hypothetical protein
MTRRIAMWSGPRNLSTAMMRAFENREDCAVTDEPLYAFFLSRTKIDHPGFDEAVASQPTDWREVVATLVGPAPGAKPIWYQKHMTHHLLPEVERGWMDHLTHCFLLRHPAEVLSSYAKTRPNVTLDDLGFVQQTEIYEHVSARTGPPIVVDSRDVLLDPRRMLSLLCAALEIPFTERMLSWPKGPGKTDGVWGVHWYRSVWSSTGFQPYEARPPSYPAELQPIVDASMPHFDALFARRLR